MSQQPTIGVKGEIRADLARSVRKWMIDNGYTWDRVIAEAIGEWARARDVEREYPARKVKVK